MKKRKGLNITIEQADAHQRKHGFKALLGSGHLPTDAEEKARQPSASTKKLRVGVRKMTRVEREFAMMLLARRSRGEILDYRFEGVRLPWGDGMLFKADFAVLNLNHGDASKITLIEVKGDHVWKHAIVRFKGCRAEWKLWFDFEFHQRTKDGQWHQLL